MNYLAVHPLQSNIVIPTHNSRYQKQHLNMGTHASMRLTYIQQYIFHLFRSLHFKDFKCPWRKLGKYRLCHSWPTYKTTNFLIVSGFITFWITEKQICRMKWELLIHILVLICDSKSKESIWTSRDGIWVWVGPGFKANPVCW